MKKKSNLGAQLHAAIPVQIRDDWKRAVSRSYSIWLSMFWNCLTSLSVLWPSMQGSVPNWAYVTVSILVAVALDWEKFNKQQGATDGA